MNKILKIMVFICVSFLSCNEAKQGSWQSIEVRPFEILVKANGEMASSETTEIGCPMVERMWEFTINFLAPEGKEAKQDQLILAFDDKELRNQLQMQMAEMATTEKNLEKTILSNENRLEDLKLSVAEAEMMLKKSKRKASLNENELSANDLRKFKIDHEMAIRKLEISKKKVTAHEIEMKSQEKRVINNLEMFKLRVDQLQKAIESMQVKAPKSGMVVYATGWRGEKPVVGESVYRGRSVLEIPDLGKMIVKALIREPDAGNVALGQDVRITLDANTDRTFKGSVSSLGQLYHIKSWDQPYMVFDAIIEIHDPDPDLMRPGMKAKVEIICERNEKSINVPLSAVQDTDKGPQVLIKHRLGKKAVSVTLGAITNNEILILSGLKGGEILWVP